MKQKKVYVLEYYDYDSVSGEGNTTEILDIYEDKQNAIDNMVSEFERRKKGYVEGWLPKYDDQLNINDFEETRELDGDAPYSCEFINDSVCLDGIGVRVLEFALV